MFEREVKLSWDDHQVSAAFPNGDCQSVSWESISCVAIETNDSGPWGADVWWLLEGSQGVVSYPQGASGDEALLQELPSRLPGFRHEPVIQAMGCTYNARFVCWERRDGL